MGALLAPIIIVGIATLGIIAFAFRNVLAPKKIANLAAYVKQGKYSAAIRTAKQLLQKDPRSSDLHYLLAKAYLEDNRAELALLELKSVGEIGQFGRFVPEPEFRETIAVLYERSA